MTTYTIPQKAIILPKFPQVSLKSFWILGLISIMALSVFYVFQINSFTKEIYSLKGYENKLASLERENEALEINSAKTNSLANLDSLVKEQNFKKAGNVKYIRIIESSVATK